MVNIGFGWGSLIGIVLAVAGASLYFLRSVRPNLARDYDIFFAAVGLLCGGILFFNAWRLDPILQFSQFLLAGSTIFFAYESVRLRGITTEQAKRSSPVVDDDRPVSRVYRAELDDDLDALDEDEGFYPPQRIRGALKSRDPQLDRSRDSRDGRSDYRDDYGNGYGDDGNGDSRESRPRRRPSGDRPRSGRPAPSNRRPPKNSRRPSGRRPMAEDDWGGDDVPPSRPPRSGGSRADGARSDGARSDGPRSGRPPRRGPGESGAGDRPRSRRGPLNLEPPPSRSDSRPDARRSSSNRRSEGTLFDDDQPYETRSRRPSGPPQDEPEMGRDRRRDDPQRPLRDERDSGSDSYVDYQPLDGPPSNPGSPAPSNDPPESRSSPGKEGDRPAAIDEPLFPDESAASRGNDRDYDDYDDYDDDLDGDRYDRP